MRKIATLLLVTILLFGVTSEAEVEVSASAQEVSSKVDSSRLSLINVFNCDIVISGGTAYLSAELEAYNSAVTECEIELELQEKVGIFWITRASWTESSHSNSLSMNKNYPITSGKTYRAKAKATAYTVNNSESVSKTVAP